MLEFAVKLIFSIVLIISVIMGAIIAFTIAALDMILTKASYDLNAINAPFRKEFWKRKIFKKCKKD
jgi:hypothetical protein